MTVYICTLFKIRELQHLLPQFDSDFRMHVKVIIVVSVQSYPTQGSFNLQGKHSCVQRATPQVFSLGEEDWHSPSKTQWELL